MKGANMTKKFFLLLMLALGTINSTAAFANAEQKPEEVPVTYHVANNINAADFELSEKQDGAKSEPEGVEMSTQSVFFLSLVALFGFVGLSNRHGI